MGATNFWNTIQEIIDDGFSSEGLSKLDDYAEQFITGGIIYKRFSPQEQHGCAQGGATHVIASILAGAEVAADSSTASGSSDFKREEQCAKTQAERIEAWAKKTGCWLDSVDERIQAMFGKQIAEGGEAHVYDNGSTLIKTIGLDYYIQPLLALDRISLHNTWFPETRLTVLGFGRTTQGDFVIIVEQPYIQGEPMTDEEIADFAISLGFTIKNPRNWTFVTPDIYLSDLHDENVIRSAEGNIFVIDCDIRINTAELRQGGTRIVTNEVVERTS
ncbi:MAG: hypothetical protein HUK12_01850 [Muribaculaceae bacterium]|nr:hypothetical protein [Muribaculaceae bacterium]